MSDLGKKRLEAVWAIAGCAAGGGAASAAPTPCAEVPKQIVLTASDIFMYAQIWKIYFQEELSRKELMAMLTELGLITVAAAGTAYIVAKGSTAILNEITDWIGPAGWGISAAIAGSLTGLFGAAWAMYCDRLYCERHAQPNLPKALPFPQIREKRQEPEEPKEPKEPKVAIAA